MLTNFDRPTGHERGFSLLEVMITLLIVSIGLLGLAGLHARSLVAESESHQKGLALGILQDISQRIESNPTGAAAILAGPMSITNIGNGYTCAAGSRLNIDLCEWNATLNADSAPPNAIGCVQAITASSEILLSIAWQGRDTGVTPSAAQSCGSGTITSGRRVASTRIRVPTLGV